MTRPTARVLALLELLQAGGSRTAADLAGRLGVDERTLRRYVQHLIDLDIPVRSERGRYGGYRLAPGFRMPPLMLTDDEAVAVLIGLLSAERSGLLPSSSAADGSAPPGPSATAVAKLRRVLPARLGSRIDDLLRVVDFTGARRATGLPDGPVATTVLLTVAEATRAGQAIMIDYRSADGRTSRRRLQPEGLVAHAGHWYVTGDDGLSGRRRTFRLDRIRTASALPDSTAATTAVDTGADAGGAATRFLDALATAPRRHRVELLVRTTREHLERRVPAGLATITPATTPPDDGPGEPGADDEAGWWRLRLQAEELSWVPSLLAWIDRPFRIVRPAALKRQVTALADRLTADAERPVDDRSPGNGERSR